MLHPLFTWNFFWTPFDHKAQVTEVCREPWCADTISRRFAFSQCLPMLKQFHRIQFTNWASTLVMVFSSWLKADSLQWDYGFDLIWHDDWLPLHSRRTVSAWRFHNTLQSTTAQPLQHVQTAACSCNLCFYAPELHFYFLKFISINYALKDKQACLLGINFSSYVLKSFSLKQLCDNAYC